LAFAAFLVWRVRIGACGVGACGFWRHRMPPGFSTREDVWHQHLIDVTKVATLHTANFKSRAFFAPSFANQSENKHGAMLYNSFTFLSTFSFF